MKKILLIPLAAFLISFIIGLQGSHQLPKGDVVNPSELSTLLAHKNFLFVNVHVPYEGEIANTDLFIPYDKVIEDSSFLPKDKNTPIILYCRSGRMSAEALQTMRKLGYTNVRHLDGGMLAWQKDGKKLLDLSSLREQVTPTSGVELPISWGDLPGQLVSLGVLDLSKLEKVLTLTKDQEALFKRNSTDSIRITNDNAQFIVDLLWGIGLAQKSTVYTDGPLGKEYKNQAGTFASTGGWTLGKKDAVSYLNKFDLIPLNNVQQQRVAEIAKTIYRPCCGNSTWFPDCNHGMAALAAIELMVAKNVDTQTIYKSVLTLNSYWFSDTYLTMATYFARQGIPWARVDAKQILGEEYSSSQGAMDIMHKVGPLPYEQSQNGGSCGA